MINRNIKSNDPRKQKRQSEIKVPEIEESAAGSRNPNGDSIYIIIIQSQTNAEVRKHSSHARMPFTYY